MTSSQLRTQVGCSMHVVQQPQRLGLQAMNDVLLAPEERMTMQTAVDGATLLQQHSIGSKQKNCAHFEESMKFGMDKL